MCDKSQGYGQIKVYNHTKPGLLRRASRRFAPLRMFQNANAHRMVHFA